MSETTMQSSTARTWQVIISPILSGLVLAAVVWLGQSVTQYGQQIVRLEEQGKYQTIIMQRLEAAQGNQYTVAQARSDQQLIQSDIAALRGRVEALEKVRRQ